MEKNEEKKEFKGEPTYEQLMEYYTTSCGCFCIDCDPHDVDIDWIRENAWELKLIDTSLLCTDYNIAPLKEH